MRNSIANGCQFIDDGFPEATEYDSNYVASRGWRRVPAAPRASVQTWFRLALVRCTGVLASLFCA